MTRIQLEQKSDLLSQDIEEATLKVTRLKAEVVLSQKRLERAEKEKSKLFREWIANGTEVK